MTNSYRPSKWGDFREDYRFTGKEEDVEVGLTYFGKRFYNALLQRWVSPDPLEVHQPGQADANLYAYVSGAALKNVDPLGLQEDDPCANGACVLAPADEAWAQLAEEGRSLGLPATAVTSATSRVSRSEEVPYAAFSVASDQMLVTDDFVSDVYGGRQIGEPAREHKAFLLGTMYHETAHREAHSIGLVDMGVRMQSQKDWLGYGQGRGPTTLEETRRAVSEAIGMYVGHRVEVFAIASQELREGVRPIQEVAANYDNEMQRVGFGYYQTAAGEEEFSKSGMLPQELKELVDSRILQGAISDTFEQTYAQTSSQEPNTVEVNESQK